MRLKKLNLHISKRSLFSLFYVDYKWSDRNLKQINPSK